MKEMNFQTFVLLCFAAATQATVIKYFEREWNMTLNDLTIRDAAVGKNNIFPYAKCSLVSGNERNCTVVLEFFHPDGVVYKNKCFTRFHTERGAEGLNLLQMRAVKNSKVVFSYVDIQDMSKNGATAYFVFRVLDTLTCKYHEGKVFVIASGSASESEKIQGEGFYLTDVLAWKDGSIDAFLIFQNLCNGARCKVSFDATGELVGKPVSYLSKDVYYNDIKIYADTYYTSKAAKDFFAVVSGYKASSIRHGAPGKERNEIKLIFVKADGNEKELLHIQQDKPLVADVDVDHHGDISICWAEQLANSNVTTVNCQHYKNHATDLHEEFYAFELPQPIKILKVRRTVHSEAPISALLVLTDECQNEACNYYVRLVSLKTNDNDPTSEWLHHNSQNMEISGLNCLGNSKEVSVSPAWNYDGLNVCVSLTCQRGVSFKREYYTSHKLVRQCFSMKYLDRAYFD